MISKISDAIFHMIHYEIVRNVATTRSNSKYLTDKLTDAYHKNVKFSSYDGKTTAKWPKMYFMFYSSFSLSNGTNFNHIFPFSIQFLESGI